MFEALKWIFLGGIACGFALTPFWILAAVGVIYRTPLAHLLPLTTIAWVCLSIYTGLNTWLSRGG